MKVKKRLWNRVNSQIFVWAGEEPKEIKFSGFRFKIPPRTETAKTGKGSIYTFESARDAAERLLPGTIVVTDKISNSPNGGVHRIFDVAACCEYLQRDREELFDQGFAIVSDVNDVPYAMQECVPLYDASQDRRAHQILQSEMERQRKMEEKGQVVTERENPQVVTWAMQHLSRRGKTIKPSHGLEDIAAVLEGRHKGPIEESAAAPPPEQPEVPESPAAAEHKDLYQECEEWGLRLTKRELEALVTNDQEQIQFIRSKLQVKKEAAAPAASA